MRAWLLGTGSGAGICVRCNIVLVCVSGVEGSECEVTHQTTRLHFEVNVDNFICEHLCQQHLAKTTLV